MERHPMVRPGGVVVLVDCPRDFLTLVVQCIGTETQYNQQTFFFLFVGLETTLRLKVLRV